MSDARPQRYPILTGAREFFRIRITSCFMGLTSFLALAGKTGPVRRIARVARNVKGNPSSLFFDELLSDPPSDHSKWVERLLAYVNARQSMVPLEVVDDIGVIARSGNLRDS